jgi:hypothetical protein
MNVRRLVAAAVLALTIGLNVGTLWTFFGTDFMDRYKVLGIPDIYLLILDLVLIEFAAVTVSYALVGFMLAGRPGAGRIAAVLLAGGAVFAATPFGYSVGGQLAFHAPQSELANALFLLGPSAYGPGYALILPGLALVFPTGRLPSRRWRLPVGLVAGSMVAGIAITLILPGPIAGAPTSHNPFGIEGLPASLATASEALISAAIVGVMILGVMAVLTRYRSGEPMLRQQLRWFVAAVLLAAVPLPLAILPGIGGPQWALVASVGLLLVPVSVWIAVTRYRLYDIDRLISRGVSWALLSGLLLAVYVGAVLLLENVLGGVTQGETVAVAASTLLAAALFQPLRRRVQAAVDHRFNRARYDAERTAIEFAGRLREQVDLASLGGDIAGVVDTALRPTKIGVWLRKPATNVSRPTTP